MSLKTQSGKFYERTYFLKDQQTLHNFSRQKNFKSKMFLSSLPHTLFLTLSFSFPHSSHFINKLNNTILQGPHEESTKCKITVAYITRKSALDGFFGYLNVLWTLPRSLGRVVLPTHFPGKNPSSPH